MNLSDDLEDLISITLVDGKITDEEMQILIKKAIKEGIDEAEFKIYLDSKVQALKSDKQAVRKEGSQNRWSKFFRWLVAKKRRVIIAVIIAGYAVFFLAGAIFNLFRVSQDAITSSNRGCESIEDCLTKYKFEEARAYCAESGYWRNSNLRKIISSEVSYYVSQEAYDMALRSINEYSFDHGFEPQGQASSNDDYNEETNWYNSLVESILVDFEADKINLKKLIYSLKPIAKIGKMYKKGGGGLMDMDDEYSFEKDNSKQETLIKRYKL